LPTLPLAIELAAKDTDYVIVGITPGGAERFFPIDFSDGVALKTITVTFEPSEVGDTTP
jgi:hypothetical protein